MTRSPSRFCYLDFLVFLVILNSSAVAVTTPPARSFVRTDSAPALTLFDPAHKVVYATVPGLSELVVISTSQHVITNRIAIPGAFSMDLSPDGTQLVVGSGNSAVGGPAVPILTLVDTGTLQILGSFPIPTTTTLSY